MKKIYFILFFQLLLSSSFAQTWQWSNPKPCGNVMEDIYFTDPYTGFIVGQGGVILKTIDGGDTWTSLSSNTFSDLYGISFPDATTGYIVGTAGTILKTMDGGSTWIDQSGSYGDLYCVNFPTANIGYTCGSSSYLFGYTKIFKTNDGGNTWNELSAPAMSYAQKVYFTSSDNGIFSGQDQNADGLLLHTTDGGMTWSTCWSSTSIYYTKGIFFTDPNTGFVVGGKGTILKTIDGGATWQTMTSGTTKDLYSIFFINALTGFVVGDQGIFLKTTNGGATWTIKTVISDGYFIALCAKDPNSIFLIGRGEPSSRNSKMYKTLDGGSTFSSMLSGTLHNLKGISFPLANTGYAAGDSGVMVKTENGGATWSILNSGDTVSLNALDFPSANTGYAVGQSGRILKTSDGGASWVVQSSGTIQPLNSVAFYNDNTGLVVGDWGTVLKTTDGGASWIPQVSGTSRYLKALSMVDASTSYAAGTWGTIIKTTDGGSTWTTIKTGSNYETYSSIDFTDPNTGYVSGNGPYILKTVDGGTTWTACYPTYDDQASFNAISFSNAMTGYAVGSTSDPVFNTTWGIIKLTMDGGSTWIDQSIMNYSILRAVCFTPSNAAFTTGDYGTILNTTESGVGLTEHPADEEGRIFPNPASDVLTIDCQRTLHGADMSIFSPDGRKMITRQISGKSIQIDINNLHTGVYFIMITDDQGMVVQKFIKK
jgi:photosystem II stability/assembly factor-like uncharacterized protein